MTFKAVTGWSFSSSSSRDHASRISELTLANRVSQVQGSSSSAISLWTQHKRARQLISEIWRCKTPKLSGSLKSFLRGEERVLKTDQCPRTFRSQHWTRSRSSSLVPWFLNADSSSERTYPLQNSLFDGDLGGHPHLKSTNSFSNLQNNLPGSFSACGCCRPWFAWSCCWPCLVRRNRPKPW